MPALIIPPGFAQCFFRWRVSGDNEEMLSSIAVRLQAGISDPAAIANRISSIWNTAWAPSFLGDAWTYVGTSVAVGNDGPPTLGESVVNTPGTSTSDMLPNNCAMLVQKRTALGGRRNRGRMFIPSGYLGEGTVGETGIIVAATLTAFNSRMAAFLLAIQTDSSHFDAAVVLHSASPVTPTVITSLTVDGRIATQRQRLRR